MRRTVRGLAAVIVLSLAGRAVAQGEGYTVRLKARAAGDTIHVFKDETISEQTRILGPMNLAVYDQTVGRGEITEYRETLLVVPADGPPTRLRRTYLKAQRRDKDGRIRDLVYHGRTLLIERKAGRYTFWLEGRGELTPAEARHLELEFNGTDERFSLANLLPKGPVRAGDYPWPVDVRPLARDLARSGKLGVNGAAARGTGRMTRVWREDDGCLCAEMRFQLEFPVTTMSVGGKKMTLGPASRTVAEIVLQMCIDGSSSFVANKDTTRIDAATGYRLADGTVGLLSINVLSNNNCTVRDVAK